MRNLLPVLLLTTAMAAACAEPVFAQGMGGMGGGYGGEGGMGGGGMGGGHRGGGRGGQGGQGEQGGTPGIQRPAPAAAAVLSAADRLTGVLTIAAQAKALSKADVRAVEADHSAVYILRSGQLNLDAVNLTSSAAPSLLDGAQDVGLASALLVASHSIANMTGGSITTTSKGTNGVYIGDPGSQAALKGVTISTKAAYAMGVAVTDDARLDGNALKVSTESDHAPAIYLRGGHATLTGGSFATGGPLSPAVMAGGDLTASGVTLTATAAGGMTVDGPRTVALTQATLTAEDVGITLTSAAQAGADAPKSGDRPSPGRMGPSAGSAMPSLSAVAGGEATGPRPVASLTVQDGQLKARRDAFNVSNIKAAITLTHVDLHTGNGVILRAVAAQWGEMGRNGGDATLTAHNQVLTGDLVTDVISNISLVLKDGSSFTGKTTSNVDVALDASSTWTLTADTRVGKLTDAGLSGDSVANIVGNGHTLNYDSRHNPALAGKTYQLAGGGVLAPGAGL